MKFLIVDDSVTMRRIVINSLQRVGFSDFVEASDGVDALGKLGMVDFIITDWNMPNLSGADLTRAIRHNAETKHLPIIMVTARSARSDILLALEAGVDSYLVKPFTPQGLREKIDSVLAAKASV